MPSRRSSPMRTKGGPCAGPKIMWSPPMMQVARRVAGAHRELRGRQGDLLAEERGVEADDVVLDDLAGLAEELERARVVEPHADLGRQPIDRRASMVASASCESGSSRGMRLTNMR